MGRIHRLMSFQERSPAEERRVDGRIGTEIGCKTGMTSGFLDGSSGQKARKGKEDSASIQGQDRWDVCKYPKDIGRPGAGCRRERESKGQRGRVSIKRGIRRSVSTQSNSNYPYHGSVKPNYCCHEAYWGHLGTGLAFNGRLEDQINTLG